MIAARVGWRRACGRNASCTVNVLRKGCVMFSNGSSSSAGQWCGLIAGFVLPIFSIGCGTQAEQEGSSAPAPVDARQQAAPSPQTSPQAPLKALAQAPRAARALIRSSATSYEIEVQSPTGFSPRAFDPVLRVGGKEFTRSRESKLVGEYGAVFQLERADFEALADASDITVGYGRQFARPVALGRLDKRSLVVR